MALGFWKAIEEAFPGTPTLLGSQDRQRPARLPRPPSTCSPTNTAPSYEKAVTKDREALLAFFGLRPGTGTIYARQTRSRACSLRSVIGRCSTKGSLSATIAKLMVFKLVIAAAKTWRRLKPGYRLPAPDAFD